MKKTKVTFFASFALFLLYIMNLKTVKKYNICNKFYQNSEYLYSTSSEISEVEREFNFDYKTLFKCYNLNASRFFDLPFVSIVRYERTIFQSVADHIYSSYSVKNLKPENVKCGDIIFLTTENLKIFKSEFYPKIQHPYILITHEFFYSVGEPWHLELLNDPKIIMWFTENIYAEHSRLKPIPLGVIPPHGENFATLYEIAKNVIPFHERSKLLYLNFSPFTNKNRSSVFEHFKSTFKNNSRVLIDEERSKWGTYLSKIANSQFVLSPPGAGMDCHRTWESLGLGAIPIVLNNSLLPVYDGLPVMIVNNWTDVTEESMKKFQNDRLTNLSKDGIAWKPKFWLRYWISNILNVKREYVNKHCM